MRVNLGQDLCGGWIYIAGGSYNRAWAACAMSSSDSGQASHLVGHAWNSDFEGKRLRRAVAGNRDNLIAVKLDDDAMNGEVSGSWFGEETSGGC